MKKATVSMKKSNSAATKAKEGTSASRLIDGRIKELGDWRGETLARVRASSKRPAPDVVEEWKWRGVPVWEHGGIICTGETYKAVVKLTFANGASLAGPFRSLQLQPRRQYAARDRYPRGRQDQ